MGRWLGSGDGYVCEDVGEERVPRPVCEEDSDESRLNERRRGQGFGFWFWFWF